MELLSFNLEKNINLGFETSLYWAQFDINDFFSKIVLNFFFNLVKIAQTAQAGTHVPRGSAPQQLWLSRSPPLSSLNAGRQGRQKMK